MAQLALRRCGTTWEIGLASTLTDIWQLNNVKQMFVSGSFLMLTVH